MEGVAMATRSPVTFRIGKRRRWLIRAMVVIMACISINVVGGVANADVIGPQQIAFEAQDANGDRMCIDDANGAPGGTQTVDPNAPHYAAQADVWHCGAGGPDLDWLVFLDPTDHSVFKLFS